MTLNDITILQSVGHQIGCHSFKHDVLSLLHSVELENDFKQCELYRHHYNTTLYSYPFGGKSETSASVFAMCKKYQYSGAFVNEEMNESSPYTINRISLNNEKNKYFIEAKLCGFEAFLKKVSHYFRGFYDNKRLLFKMAK